MSQREQIKYLRKTLTERVPVFCIGISIMEPSVIEMAALAGYDAAIIDGCQTLFSPEKVHSMILAADARKLPVIIRAASHSDAAAYLNYGVCGVMFENVRTADEARAIVNTCKYPPLGRRGISARSRSNDYGLAALNEKTREDNKNLLVIIQIEDAWGLSNMDDILKVPGIDLVSSGRNDLAQAMGVPGQPGHPDVIKAEKMICDRVKKAGLPPVLLVPFSPDHARDLIAEGYSLFSIGQDSDMLFSAFSGNIAKYRDQLSGGSVKTKLPND